MYIEEAIKEAVKEGYTLPDMQEAYRGELLFGLPWYIYSVHDPAFWQALGKARGWGKWSYDHHTMLCKHCGINIGIQPSRESGCNHVHYPEDCPVCSKIVLTWEDHWHRFIDHLAEGKDAESFFAELLTPKSQ